MNRKTRRCCGEQTGDGTTVAINRGSRKQRREYSNPRHQHATYQYSREEPGMLTNVEE